MNEMPDHENDLRARVVGLEHSVQSNSQRLTTIETWQRQREIDSARNDEKWVAMEARIDARFSGLESSNKNIQSTLSRINWMVIGALVAAVMTFIVAGGLNKI
ncbi:hypothetical protein DKP76_05425 [Falsochrobactrum shanghaiense]|uniref:Uncharacterized protein n=2 Tax=Falsochrobactrum shanghaiense TaxID=2201899 RepID=A0A316JAM9_9HYPH|nr:hypothetical protein DKP76_05425 [Falsochrobactrum shanghaiense]